MVVLVERLNGYVWSVEATEHLWVCRHCKGCDVLL